MHAAQITLETVHATTTATCLKKIAAKRIGRKWSSLVALKVYNTDTYRNAERTAVRFVHAVW